MIGDTIIGSFRNIQRTFIDWEIQDTKCRMQVWSILHPASCIIASM